MRVKYKNSVKYQAIKRISRMKSYIILRSDLSDLGSYRQVSRVINQLIKDGKLVKLSYGIYAKSYISKYINEPLIKGGFDIAARDALNRLGVKWVPGSAEQAYNNRESTQVPVRNIVQLKSRLRRQIGYGDIKIYYEGNVNAK